MNFKQFIHWLFSMGLSALAAWWLQHHPGSGAEMPAIFGVGCASHWIGHLGAKPDEPSPF